MEHTRAKRGPKRKALDGEQQKEPKSNAERQRQFRMNKRQREQETQQQMTKLEEEIKVLLAEKKAIENEKDQLKKDLEQRNALIVYLETVNASLTEANNELRQRLSHMDPLIEHAEAQNRRRCGRWVV